MYYYTLTVYRPGSYKVEEVGYKTRRPFQSTSNARKRIIVEHGLSLISYSPVSTLMFYLGKLFGKWKTV